MPRAFVPRIPPEKDAFPLRGETARYLLAVLRTAPGDEVVLFDGEGRRARATVVRTRRAELDVEVKERLPVPEEPPGGIVLLQGMLKGRKMDLVVQKATELGVKEIVPLITERTQVRETRKLERWQTIAREAARQCGRPLVPAVRPPAEADLFFGQAEGLSGFIFWEEGGRPLGQAELPPEGRDVHAAVGPEGGFTGAEVEMALSRGLEAATLGPLILRAETAALAAVTLLRFLLGRMR
ncbi:MAG: 16S rRNA (uracil(1498)-N(3))-methyltransferase [Nitrospirota bacterium]|jgi:16S rRNA (uracil1498-N3)-methyltransferase